jgi:predicted RecB family endonuclease
MNKISEKRIENGLARHLSSYNSLVRKQVAFTQKRIDIVVQNENKTWAIEVKIHDWKGALRQAFQNKIAFDFSYVAIWHKYSHRALNNRQVFESMGIGLIVVNSDYSANVEVSPATSEESLNPLAYGYMLQKI